MFHYHDNDRNQEPSGDAHVGRRCKESCHKVSVNKRLMDVIVSKVLHNILNLSIALVGSQSTVLAKVLTANALLQESA